MKKTCAILLTLALCLALSACGKTAGEPTGVPAGSTDPTVEPVTDPSEEAGGETSGETPPTVPENVLKAVYRDDNRNEITLFQNEDESYGMVISLYRLTQLEGDAVPEGDGFLLNGIDASGHPIALRFYPETDSYTLEVTDSVWAYLPVGQTFPGFLPQIRGGDTDASDGITAEEYAGFTATCTAADLDRSDDFAWLMQQDFRGTWYDPESGEALRLTDEGAYLYIPYLGEFGDTLYAWELVDRSADGMCPKLAIYWGERDDAALVYYVSGYRGSYFYGRTQSCVFYRQGAAVTAALSAYREILEAAPAITGEHPELADAAFGYDRNQEQFGAHNDLFALADLDLDGVPELMTLTTVNFRWTPVSVYTYADGAAVLLQDPLDADAHGTFELCSTANGAWEIESCADHHIHRVWRGTDPVGNAVAEDYAYRLEGTTLIAVECGAEGPAVSFAAMAKANTAENRTAGGFA